MDTLLDTLSRLFRSYALGPCQLVMPPPPVPQSSRPAPTNPFYPSSSTPPPSYQPSSRPAPTPPENVSYGSLADLTRNRQARQQDQEFEYTPQPERQGYRVTEEERPSQSGTGRRMPPPPGMRPTPPPPRRNVPRTIDSAGPWRCPS